MPTWIIEPRDPLIVRDGRPFTAIPGSRATSVSFPFPSTTTGALRTRMGIGLDGRFDSIQIDALRQIAVRGPLLVELADDGTIRHWYAPAPADALILEPEPSASGDAYRRPLVPLDIPSGAKMNLQDSLAPVGSARPDPRKPLSRPPRFWYWTAFTGWLTGPKEGPVMLRDLGHAGPGQEQRTHVGVARDTQTAVEGALFQTSGLAFTAHGPRRLALVLCAEATPRPGVAPLGGESRIASWRASAEMLPALPAAIRQEIVRTKACRVVLLTPSVFAKGYYPSWLLETREGVTPTVKGIAVGRAQVVSGWDFAAQPQRPKPTRRLAPAGTVLFLLLAGDQTSIERWVEATWLQCISDDPQDRRDGFGLVALGTWSGQLMPMEREA